MMQSLRICYIRLALFISIMAYLLLGNEINTQQVKPITLHYLLYLYQCRTILIQSGSQLVVGGLVVSGSQHYY